MPTFTFRIAQPSAIIRTLNTWLLANLGGTAWLAADFPLETADDLVVPLLIGLTIALLSLAFAPVALPFFVLAQRCATGWQRWCLAVGAVVLAGALSNVALVHLLPVGTLTELAGCSVPYLAAGGLAVVWLFRGSDVRVRVGSSRVRRTGAALLERWQPRQQRTARFGLVASC